MAELEEVMDEVMAQMYREAEPGLDWHDLRENPDDYPENWFRQHHLDGDRQQELVDEAIEEYNLTSQEATSLTMTCLLDYAPKSSE